MKICLIVGGALLFLGTLYASNQGRYFPGQSSAQLIGIIAFIGGVLLALFSKPALPKKG